MTFRGFKCALSLAALLLVGSLASNAQRRSGQDTSASDKGGKARVVVLGSSSPDIGWTQNVTTASLEDALQQSGRFELITGSQRDKLLSEQGFNNSDLVDPKQATQVGRLLSARYIIIGNALEVSASKKKVPHSFGGLIPRTGIGGGDEISSDVRTKVQIQMIDATTGVVKLSRSYDERVSKDSIAHSSSDYDTLREGYRKAMEKVATAFVHEFGMSVPTEATVVFIRGDRVALDIGSDQSARVGQEFEVVTQDEPIKNAAGEVLSYVTTKYARLRIVSVEPKISWTTVVQTYDQDGNPDPQPRIERIKLNYTARQVQ